MSLRLERLRLHADTSGGVFEAEVRFEDGLVLIRADNSHGKSTIMQSILYALGLEAVLGPRHDVPLPAAMTSILSAPDGTEHSVRESSVMLEVRGAEDRRITVQRWARHPRIDKNLIRTWSGPALSRPETTFEQSDYFVRRSGAAQHDLGFHKFFAEFIGWDLPMLTTSEGREVPLYVEFLFPVLFVEQKRGWGGIQANMPPYSGIQDTRRRAIEFLLDLGVYRRLLERQQLRASLEQVRREYQREVESFRDSIRGTGVLVQGIESELPASWPPSVPPALVLPIGEGEWTPLSGYLESLRSRLATLSVSEVPSTGDVAPELQERVATNESELAELSAAGAVLLQEMQHASAEQDALATRIQALAEDRQRYRDALTLHQLGSEQISAAIPDECPTCHQLLPEALVIGEDSHAMTLEQNLRFLDEQMETFEEMREQGQEQIGAHRERISRVRERIAEVSRILRAARTTLVAPANRPSEASIRERLQLEDSIETLDIAATEFVTLEERVRSLVHAGREIQSKLDLIPPLGLSEDDRDKLSSLEASLVDQLTSYGFSSVSPTSIKISEDSYQPAREGYDLWYDLSASDGIRLIWAYLLGLLEVARDHSTNHPGLLMFDEPRQQEAALLSFEALLRRASGASNFGQQVVVATSQPVESIEAMLEQAPYSLVAFDAPVLQPSS